MATSSHSWRNDAVYVDIHGICRRYSIGRRTVWRYARDGVIPPPVYLAGPGSGARWRVDDLDRHDAERDGRRNTSS